MLVHVYGKARWNDSFTRSRSTARDKQQLSKGEGTHTDFACAEGRLLPGRLQQPDNPPPATHNLVPTKPRYAKFTGSRTSSIRMSSISCRPEIVKVKASDGTLLYARMIKPAGFEAGKKYPAVVMVYGGPGVQSYDAWQGLSWDRCWRTKAS